MNPGWIVAAVVVGFVVGVVVVTGYLLVWPKPR